MMAKVGGHIAWQEASVIMFLLKLNERRERERGKERGGETGKADGCVVPEQKAPRGGHAAAATAAAVVVVVSNRAPFHPTSAGGTIHWSREFRPNDERQKGSKPGTQNAR